MTYTTFYDVIVDVTPPSEDNPLWTDDEGEPLPKVLSDALAQIPHTPGVFYSIEMEIEARITYERARTYGPPEDCDPGWSECVRRICGASLVSSDERQWRLPCTTNDALQTRYTHAIEKYEIE